MRRRKFVIGGLGTVAAAFVAANGVDFVRSASAVVPASRKPSLPGVPAWSRSDELFDHTGRPFEHGRLTGRPTLLTFGFTQCGTTCPASMAVARELLHTLADRPVRPDPLVQVVLVTLDPLTDSPQRLREYLHGFDERLVGVTGSHSGIGRLVDAFKVRMWRRPGDASAPLEHGTAWYLLDAQARIVSALPHTSSASHLAERIDSLQVAARS